jgi:4-hydroxybenzoate polyprenyltransferase
LRCRSRFLGAVLAANGLRRPGSVSGSSWRWSERVRPQWLSTASPIRSFDARNPRTASRALPAGLLSVGFVWAFTDRRGSLVFCSRGGRGRSSIVWDVILAPVALACVLLYSFTKRWTQFTHLVLGACLSIAPTGAWMPCAARLAAQCPCCYLSWSCLDRRFRRAVCVPGLRLRSHGRIEIHSGALRNCTRLWIARALHAAHFWRLSGFCITGLGPVAFAA